MSIVQVQQTKRTGGNLTYTPSDDTRIALLEKSSDSIKEILQHQARHLDKVTESLEKIRDRMEVSFDTMSKDMNSLNKTMYQQGFQMIQYFRWFAAMGIITVVAVCILAGSNFFFKWKEVELRSGSANVTQSATVEEQHAQNSSFIQSRP